MPRTQAPEGEAGSGTESRGDHRRATIRAAAIEQFMSRGYAGTSMAHIASAAGVSRPAVYQYFRDKHDVFAAAFAGVFEERVDAALAALAAAENVQDGLEGLLQRYEGDLWEMMATSPHQAELLEAKSETVAAAVDVEVTRLWDAAELYLAGTGSRSADRVAGWLDVLRWSPRGMMSDQPAVDRYRLRLSALARSVAADIAASNEVDMD